MTITFTEHVTEVTFTDQTEAGFTFVTQIGGTGGGGDVPPARLLPATIGDDGQVATVVSGAPAWADPADSGAPLSDAAPEPLAETAAAGTAEEAARADHQHELPTPSQIGVWDSETLLIGESHLPASIARDTEVAAAVSAHAAASDPHGDRAYAASLGSAYQPVDSDLTAIAALTTTSYGRALLTLADSAAARSTIGARKPTRMIPDSAYTGTRTGYGVPLHRANLSVTTWAIAAGALYLATGSVEGGATPSYLTFTVTASGLSAGQQVVIGCFNKTATGRPGTLAWSQAVTVGTSTGTFETAVSGKTLPDEYFIGFLNPSGNAGSVTVTSAGTDDKVLCVSGTDRGTLQLNSQASMPSDLSSAPFASSASGSNLGPVIVAPVIYAR